MLKDLLARKDLSFIQLIKMGNILSLMILWMVAPLLILILQLDPFSLFGTPIKII